MKFYEDDYNGVEYPSADALVADIDRMTNSLNWPVWVELRTDDVPAVLEVGYFQQRHGRTHITYSNVGATEEHVTAVRHHMLRWWAGRAGAGFGRWQ